MHWREMMSHKSSDTNFLSKCQSGTEWKVGAPFSFMLYWKDNVKLAYRAGTVCAWRCWRFKADDSFHTTTGLTVLLLHTSVFNCIIWDCRSGLRPLACWNCGFESRRVHGCLSLVSDVCCQVKPLRRADHSSRGVPPCVVCLSVIAEPQQRGGLGTLWLPRHGKNNNHNNKIWDG